MEIEKVEIEDKKSQLELDESLYKKCMSVLERGDKILNQMQHPNIGMSLRTFLYELDMAWLAISTRKKSDAAMSDYYMPLAYEKVSKFVRRVNQVLFEGGDFYDFSDADENVAPTDLEIFKRKKILDKHIHDSQLVPSMKDGTMYGVRMGTLIQETTPCSEKEYFKYKTFQDGYLVERIKNKEKKLIDSKYIDLLDLYISDPYCETLDQDLGILKEYTWAELKALEANGYFSDVDKIKNNNYENPFNLNDSYRSLRRNLLKFDDNRGSDGKVTGYKTSGKYVTADVWYKQKELVTVYEYSPVEDTDVQIKVEMDCWYVATICGNAILRKKKAMDLFGINFHPYRLWKFEYRRNEFYGWGMLHRLLKTQWVQNQIFNLGIDGIIKKLNGNFFVSTKVKDAIDAQIKGGMKSGSAIAVPTPTGATVRDVVVPVEYPDPSNLFITATEYIANVFSQTTGSTNILAGQPTHTQLDRTAAGYQTALGEASIDIKDVVYSLQDNYISKVIEQAYMIVSRTMWKRTLVDRVVGQNGAMEPLFGRPEDMFGLPDINVYGGSLYLEREKQIKDLLEVSNFVQANARFGERINYEWLLQKIVDLKRVDINIIRPQTPQEQLMGIIKSGVPIEEIKAMVDNAAFIKEQEVQQQEADKVLESQQEFINRVNNEKSFREASADKAKMDAIDSAVEAKMMEE